jgi:hypothetical protein
MFDEPALTCFASFHWDDDPERAFLQRISAACQAEGVRLQFEAFGLGTHVQTRMETLVFDSFVFLFTPASWASLACQTELRTARIRHVPVITVRLRGEVPPELRDRVFLDAWGLCGEAEAAALARLAETVATRARLHRQILSVAREADAAVPWRAAELLAAEAAAHLAELYHPEAHPATRYWLALALGRAGTSEAGAILDRFGWETHPFPLLGIREARRSITA